MISLAALFWIFVIIFALVGAMRGWTKEILVTFTLVLSIFVIVVMLQFIPFMTDYLTKGGDSRQVIVRAAILVIFAFFGYQSPKLQRISEVIVKERLQDSFLGLIVGAVNGYFLMGSLLYYLNQFNYPFDFLSAPPADLTSFLMYMPPAFLGVPAIYFAVAIAFTFVVVVVI
jgi:uncharacterized membrane protein required for colicin V production